MRHDVGKGVVRESIEGCFIAKKAGDRDQHILVQCIYFGRVFAQIGRVLRKAFDLQHGHAMQNAPFERAPLVCEKIDACLLSEHQENIGQSLLLFLECLDRLFSNLSLREIGMETQPGKYDGNNLRWEYVVDTSG